LPKRGKERENFPKEGEGKGRNDPLDYAKSHKNIHLGDRLRALREKFKK
jgi:hypothetical protein